MRTSVEWRGLEKFHRMLDPHHLEAPNEHLVESGAARVEVLAIAGVPVGETGRLKRAHRRRVGRGIEPLEAEADVGVSGLSYPVFVHYGTVKMEGQPWLESAADQVEGELRSREPTWAGELEGAWRRA